MSELLMHPMGGGTGSDDLTATAANVLSGKTAVTSDSDDEAIEGTMANNGAMDVTLTPAGNGTTSKEVAEGYYSGGTITADGAAAYSAGHSQGVTDADNRVNTSSASYNSGYAKGKTDGQHNPIIKTIEITAHASGKWVSVRGSTTVSSMSKILAVGIPSVGYGSLQNLSCSYSGNVVSLYFETQDAYGDGANFTFHVVVVGY